MSHLNTQSGWHQVFFLGHPCFFWLAVRALCACKPYSFVDLSIKPVLSFPACFALIHETAVAIARQFAHENSSSQERKKAFRSNVSPRRGQSCFQAEGNSAEASD